MAQIPSSGSLTGKRALITGSSRGVGAATARLLADAGADVVLNYRDEKKARRADALLSAIEADGGTAIAFRADLTDQDAVAAMLDAVRQRWGGLDLLVLNASGGMESQLGEDYALRLNRDAQVGLLRAALPLLPRDARVVFVTSHQAHFVETVPTMPQYEAVARSKRAGEDALREMVPELDELGIEFVVVSGDMIEGTVTALLLDRAAPGALEARRAAAGRLYSVEEFAGEVAAACLAPIPTDHIRYVGDVSEFVSA